MAGDTCLVLAPLHYLPESRQGTAQLSTDKNAIARARSRAQDGLPLRHAADDDNVGQNSGRRFRRIAAGEDHSVLSGKPKQAAGELTNPRLRQIPGKSQREERRDRFAPHGGDIAQSSSQATVSDRFCGMPVPAKMNPLQAEVRGDEQFVSTRHAQHGAVVPDAVHNRALPGARSWARGGGEATKFGDQRFFRKRHGALTIPPKAAPILGAEIPPGSTPKAR